MEVLNGIDALLYFKNGDGNYLLYGCCETFEVNINTETKSVKTIGDGTCARSRRQEISYSVSASGIIRIDDPSGTFNNFDLLEYQMQGVDIEWRAIYKKNDHSTAYTYLYGTMLIVQTSIVAPADFVNGSFEAEGQGELLRGVPPSCSSAITDYTFAQFGLSYAFYKMTVNTVSGSPTSYQWRVDGGAIDTSLDNEWFVNVISLPAAGIGAHTLEVWPVCANGILGTLQTVPFTTTL